MAGLRFPAFYRPRPYQRELHTMWQSKRIGIAVMARQSGKDMSGAMEMCDARLKKPKSNGLYIGVSNTEIRRILWNKSYPQDNGVNLKLLKDNVPSSLVDWRDTTMTGRFTNDSLLEVLGFYETGRQQQGVGTSYDDYLITELSLFRREDPVVPIIPIIEQEAGDKRLMVVATPRGMGTNPLWSLMQSIEGRDDAQVIVRTIDDLNEQMVREGLPPVLSQATLEKIQATYIRRFGNDRMFRQEYYCEFGQVDAASVYGDTLTRLIEEGRNLVFNLNPAYPVFVAFDIGAAGRHSDYTSWIAYQWINNQVWMYDCGEGQGRPLPDYVDDLRERHWFSQLAGIILPWDSKHHEVSIAETPLDMVKKKFPNVRALAKSSKVYNPQGMDEITDIQLTRMALSNGYIHSTNCARVLECMEKFRFAYDAKNGQFRSTPVHDEFSHMMDAMRYVVQSTKEIDFFGLEHFQGGNIETSYDYTQDWSGVWSGMSR